MKIQYCSDLHLEFRENAEYIKRNPIQQEADILLLAGDIVPFAVMKKHKTFFDLISTQFKTVYWVPGNHEYYHSDIADRSGSFVEQIRENIFLLNNQVVNQEGVKFIFSTLWSNITDVHRLEIQRGMADFHVIRHGDTVFNSWHANRLHQEAREFISGAIRQEHSGKTVVMTHHVPTFYNYPQKYKGDVLDEAFASELSGLIETSGVDYWLYGHHHQFVPKFTIGMTSLITNQLGYVKYKEHLSFDSTKAIDI